jgi:photosystem II stability/assembly factor-like uncharacterized protein
MKHLITLILLLFLLSAESHSQCENTFYSSWFVNRDTGWFVGTPSVAEPYTIMQTTDGGSTWQQQQNPTERNLCGVSFGSDEKGVAAGLSGALVYTSDGGTLWEASPDGGYARWESVYLTESGKAWAVGQNGSVLYSTDWGHSWSAQESGIGTGVELWEVYFINDNEGWIVGGGMGQPAVILHTTKAGINPAVQTEDHQEINQFHLGQNYPNPFRATTRITYRIPSPELVKIRVFNALGQVVEELLDTRMPAGTHHMHINGRSYTEGVYFYRMEAGGFTAMKKMTLLK